VVVALNEMMIMEVNAVVVLVAVAEIMLKEVKVEALVALVVEDLAVVVKTTKKELKKKDLVVVIEVKDVVVLVVAMVGISWQQVKGYYSINHWEYIEAGQAADTLLPADAVVIALKSRSIPSADAVEISLEALQVLQGLGVERIFFKYCSTFDSTTAGNIGPVAEALAWALHQFNVWYCPEFPENGRTVYCGYLFVNGVPLHESGMKDHPLNPMTDSNLVRWLQPQCKNKVGLVTLATVRSGDVVKQEGCEEKSK
jgi:hypothetical protein